MPDDRPVSPGEWLRKEASANKDDYDGCSLGSAAVLVAASRLERALSTPAGPACEGCGENANDCWCGRAAPSPREEAATEDQIEAATDAILALNRTEEDYGDGQRLTHIMARRRAIAALSAARPSSPTPEEPKVAMVKAASMEELFWLNGAVAAEIVERLPGKFESLTAFFYEAADQHLADPGAATTKEGR